MAKRLLTEQERFLARSVFGDAIDLDRVTINRRKWWPFQPRNVVMAPDGQIWCHPAGSTYCACFASADLSRQSLFIHEMTHVWQWQQGIFLPIARHPFCRYDYVLKTGKPFHRYGIEQQAEIVAHAFLLRCGGRIAGAPSLAELESLLPFCGRNGGDELNCRP